MREVNAGRRTHRDLPEGLVLLRMGSRTSMANSVLHNPTDRPLVNFNDSLDHSTFE